MQIKCKQFECGVCGKVSTIQLFFRSNGELAYGRARHYLGRENNKPQFEYHKQTLEYLKSKLSKLPTDRNNIGHMGHTVNDDLEKPQNSSKISSMAGGEGFEPSTLSLEG
jgi:hypothetical protein